MDAFKNAKAWLVAIPVLMWFLLTTPGSADFDVSQMRARLDAGKVIVSGNLELGLNTKVEEAVSKGIPLDIDIELRLYRTRPILWARRLSDWRLRRQIRFHALSGQYLVSEIRDGAEVLESFTSLQQALRHMGTINDREFPINAITDSENALLLDTRVSLDIETLPAPLRPVAYTSLDWHLNSGWTTWTVQQ
ncbi:MAG: hypothetical protein AMJ68_06885 [Acidithiobacillales bacterium SG8_45]|jgi:hypothetical protein|nr:MAG: hypothetical protein AMJ68_06885 [Acidithiobacillales bacterium SG8_45]